MKILLFLTLSLYFAFGEHIQNSIISSSLENIQAKCGAEIYEKLKIAQNDLKSCVNKLVSFSMAKLEIKLAEESGFLNKVLRKYCPRKLEIVNSCLQSYMNSFEGCFKEDEIPLFFFFIDVFLANNVKSDVVTKTTFYLGRVKLDCVAPTLEDILYSRKLMDSLFEGSYDTENCGIETCDRKAVDVFFRTVNKENCEALDSKNLSFNNHNIIKRSVATIVDHLYNSTENLHNFKVLVKEKCTKSNVNMDTLSGNIDEALKCISEKKKLHPIFVTSKKDFKENIKNCTQQVIKETETCFGNEEKYWPKTYLETKDFLIDYLYDNKEAIETASHEDILSCIHNLEIEAAKKEMKKCFKKPNVSSFTKEDMCLQFTNGEKCVTEVITKRCNKDTVLIQIIPKWLEAMAQRFCAEAKQLN